MRTLRPVTEILFVLVTFPSLHAFCQEAAVRSTPPFERSPSEWAYSEERLPAADFPASSVSSSSQPVEPDMAPGEALSAAAAQAEPSRVGIRPFGAFALALKAGAQGFGFDVATPVSQRFNLRAGGSFFQLSSSTVQNGLHADGTFHFRSGKASLDWFPFGGSFRLSPGVVFYNDNHIDAVASVPGGGTFTLDNVDYTSDPTDPIRGTGNLTFGNKVAPSFTLGFGNMIPRKGGHWSVPVEIGFEYIDQPRVTFALSGSACQAQQGCGPIATDAQAQANLRAEENSLNDMLSPLRFFPIASLGVSYRFGH